jgi:2-(3-amino-3-carboxypropyl)histidine synthase
MIEKYDIEIQKIVDEAKKIEAKTIVIQLPDGLKNDATKLQVQLEELTGATIVFWAGSNFGACDIPTNLPKEYDMLVAIGHAFAYNIKD